jgi:hypothetical protein
VEPLQVRTALSGLTGLARMTHNNPCGHLVPHFEMIFDLISQRLFDGNVVKEDNSKSESNSKSNSKNKNKSIKSQDKDEMIDKSPESQALSDWPRIKNLPKDYQVQVLCVRFLATFVSALIRQHTHTDNGEEVIDLDTISSIRSICVGFFLTRLNDLESTNVDDDTGVLKCRLQYSLLKGLLVCLPDASVSDLTSHLQPLFLALQATHQGLRYKLSTLLCRLIRSRRLSDAFIPLLFFAGGRETCLLIRSTLKALIAEIVRSWPCDSTVISELLPVLCVYTVRHPDYANLQTCEATRSLVRSYYEYFVEGVVTASNCGAIYEAVGRLKLFHFVPLDPSASDRLYLVSELAQEAIKNSCTQHHWPLQQLPSSNSTTLSLLVPDVLVELDESAQIQNIHTIYAKEPSNEEKPQTRKMIRRRK